MQYPKRKYRKGFSYHSYNELIWALEEGKWVYWGDKVMHPGFLIGMTLRTIMAAINRGLISEAIDQIKEYSIKAQEEYLAKLR